MVDYLEIKYSKMKMAVCFHIQVQFFKVLSYLVLFINSPFYYMEMKRKQSCK